MAVEAATPDLVLVTGPSGAGRTTAIRALEDVGFEVIDNLPMSLVGPLLAGETGRPLALGIDVRNRDFSTDAVLSLADRLRADPRRTPRLLFLDCGAQTLVARYSETRRRHPLSNVGDVETGIAREIDLLSPLRDAADDVIDTTGLTVHDLKAQVQRQMTGGRGMLSLSVQSFSYKRGLPRGLDLVFDVRFLNNPHWVSDLRDLTGREEAVANHVTSDPRFDEFYGRLRDMITFLLPAYKDEGRAHLTIGVGCTGGRHRSVVVAERMSADLAEAGWRVSTRHRELDRVTQTGAPARGQV
ncbi:RNase adapter RapZ [Jannaschia aquimarina]|uniref:GlmZ(SRNA)-inactivating NTPase n=1 Tax=Jannaschia aquimarina TaxID=935700 RepID=A0A0D1CTA2_9RHOB|nr:RNase adapter RapZ [Jannaschia aquimarina]KIT17997.1 glmZ(sRNA)-inactivating NTPase [Jannaschia aquimarina]SNS88209.1 UPF0042 nucleotide-binding protein [Jannaschia aquimarina]